MAFGSGQMEVHPRRPALATFVRILSPMAPRQNWLATENSSTNAEAAQHMHARLTHANALRSEQGARDERIADTRSAACRLGIGGPGRKTCRCHARQCRQRRYTAARRCPALCAACARGLALTVTTALANRIDVQGCSRAAAAWAVTSVRVQTATPRAASLAVDGARVHGSAATTGAVPRGV